MLLIALLALAPVNTPHICNYARIRATGPRAEVTVRAAPRRRAQASKTLKAGTAVYICDETRDWVELRFQSDGYPCPGTANGIRVDQTGACDKGWVRQAQFIVISG